MEFVHSLSPKYLPKHEALMRSQLRPNVAWIFDGDAYLSKRRRVVAQGGIKRMLKPNARELVHRIGRGHAYVHYQGKLWQHWKHDIFYPVTRAEWVDAFCMSFTRVFQEGLRGDHPNRR